MDWGLEDVLDRVALDVEAGVAYHQSVGEALRSRSIPRGGSAEVVRAYQPFNAAVLYAQLVERGLEGGSGEFVTGHQCGKLGGELLGEAAGDEGRFVVEAGDRRGIAVGIAGAPGIVQRPGVYTVVHSETQTTLESAADPRVLHGRDRDAAARDVAVRVLAGARVRFEPADRVEFGRDGDGLVLCHPRQSGFPSSSAWASSLVGAVAALVSEDSAAHDEVRLRRFGEDALREHNGRARRSRSGARAEAGTPEADAVVSGAVAGLYKRACGVLAKREDVRIEWDRPAGEALFDSGRRSFRPKAPRLFKQHGGRQWEAFQHAALAGLCRSVGGERERAAAEGAQWVDRARGLGVVEAVAGPLPGLDCRPALAGEDRAARAALVGALVARPLVEAAGVPYVPVAGGEEVDARQADVVRREGLRSVCADASNIGGWALEVERGRPLGPVGPEAGPGVRGDGVRDAQAPRPSQELLW